MVDRYTKGILTVIAVSLSVIAFKEVVLPAKAQGYTGPVHVILDQIGDDQPLGYDAVLPVSIQQQD